MGSSCSQAEVWWLVSGIFKSAEKFSLPLIADLEKSDRTETTTATYSRDGNTLMTAHKDGKIRWFDLETGDRSIFQELEAPVHSSFYSNDGSMVVSTSGHHVDIWSLDGSDRFRYTHTDKVNYAIFSPDDSFVLACGEQGKILQITPGVSSALVYDGGRGPRPEFYRGISFLPQVRSLEDLNPDVDKTGGALSDLEQGEAPLVFIAPSKNGRAHVWQIGQTEAPIHSFNPELWYVQDTNFSHDGKRVVIAGWRQIKIYDWETKEERLILADGPESHGNHIIRAFFSPDDSRIISHAWDGSVKIWDSETGELQIKLQHDSRYGANRWAEYHPHQDQLMVASRFEMISYWLNPGDLIEAATEHYRIGSFTLRQIEQYQLDAYPELAGLINGEDDLTPLLDSMDEALLFNFGEYFRFKAARTSDSVKKERFQKWARELFETARSIGVVHVDATYEERL